VMTPSKSLALDKLTWAQARTTVLKLNPELAKLIDEVDPGPDCVLYKARYPYGSQMLSAGEFCLPTENGGVINIRDHRVPLEIKEQLGYNPNANPLALVTSKSAEIFLTLEDRVIPFRVVKKGGLMGVWHTLDGLNGNRTTHHAGMFLWDVTAGARSVFMLPKISEMMAHSKLKQAFHVNVEKPKHSLDHWKVFRTIAAQPAFVEPWHTEVLYFSKAWFEYFNDLAWLKLRHYLINQAWLDSEFWRNQFIWNLSFARALTLKNIKASAYIADTVKHILTVALGAVPGFQPALDSTLAPIRGIQDAYINHYELKSYHPIIMQPASLSLQNNKDTVYYSLQYPSALELAPKASERSSTISDLYDVRALMTKYLKEIHSNRWKTSLTPLYELAKRIELQYYHSNVDLYTGMLSGTQMIDNDPNFAAASQGFGSREFPKTSSFIKGAIAISHPNSE
jgi:hypothetical protein